jgi:hypothetical protein
MANATLPSDATQALQSTYDTANSNFASGYKNLMDQQSADETNTLNSLNTQYDIPGLTSQIQGYKTQILGLQNTLNNLAGNVATRDKGTLTNQAQLDRQVTAEGAPIQKNLTGLGLAEAPLETNLTTAQTNITQQMQMLADKQARDASGYTTANQALLNGLLDKLNAQRTLDATSLKQANDLALQEQQYNLALRNQMSTASAGSVNIPGLTSTPAATPAGSSAAKVGTLSRVGNTNNVTVAGWSGTREAAADRIAGTQDRNSVDWQNAYKQILQEFPDIANKVGAAPLFTEFNKALMGG